MQLSRLLEHVRVSKLHQTMFGRMVVTHDVEVHALQHDSRKVQKNDCYVAIRGSAVDGHLFIKDACQRGATVIVVEDDAAYPDSLAMHSGITKVVVPDSRKALAQMASNFFRHPSHQLTMVGITGTNGKTTTTHIVRSIFEAQGEMVGMIGTIDYRIGGETLPARHTTPDALELNSLLRRMLDAGCTAVAMEVSSHALHQYRVHALAFDVAAFTNLTQDHLDYHGDMESYFRAKKILFDSLPRGAVAVTNADDPQGEAIVADTEATVIRYGLNADADISATDVSVSINGTSMTVLHRAEATTVHSPLLGKFNVYNVLAAFAVGVALGIPKETLRRGIESLQPVKGRFERLPSPQGWTAIIDYAHTPDALEKCLRAIRELVPAGRIITVFGAGGDRDRTKRPAMGSVAATLSDVTVVTSDNPRTEDPQRIIDDIVAGMPEGTRYHREENRRRAIFHALSVAAAGDVVLIAGKGHEEYQILGSERIHFSDREVVEEFIAQ